MAVPDAGPDAATFPVGHPDDYWLERIGRGKDQLEKVCARGRIDRVTRALCGTETKIDGLGSLFGALALESGFENLAMATNSSGLSFRTTSVLNPRLFLGSRVGDTLDLKNMAVVAFSRGENLAEIIAYDAVAYQLNFYLLSYRQACHAQGCSAEDLLSSSTESGWTEWTIYDETDLDDTPLGCLSCHQPDGADTPRTLLMRDLNDPWFHWLPATDQQSSCFGGTPPAWHAPLRLAPDLRADFEHAHGPTGGYGGHDIAATRLSSGHNLFSLIVLAVVQGLTAQPNPFVMDSRSVVEEWRCEEANDTWRAYRAQLLGDRGFPVPYYGFDVLDRKKAASALQDYPAYLKANRDRSPFAILRDFIAEEAQMATGALVDGAPAAESVLRQACVRCHDDRAPAGSRRSGFNLDKITSVSAAAALKRLDLPEDSPFVMPPRRAATLSADAKHKLVMLLRAHVQ